MTKESVMRWHYSQRIAATDLERYAVYENGRWIGCLVFGLGASPRIGSPFGLDMTQICELTRVALDAHTSHVSRIVAVALRLLRRARPLIELVVSYADDRQGHTGGIYQAGNWTYIGRTEPQREYIVLGKRWHGRSLGSKYPGVGQSIPWLRANVDPCAEAVPAGFRHKYVMPLSERMRALAASLRKPFPKRAGSIVDDVAACQAAEGGSIPTPALHLQTTRSAERSQPARRRLSLPKTPSARRSRAGSLAS